MRIARELGEDRAWAILEELVLEKRMEWLERRPEILGRVDSLAKAFEVFYLDYLGLEVGDYEIVEMDDDKIVVRCRNFCPVLEACKRLGLDTRSICRLVYERPTREFFSRLNPRIKFERNYDAIRPRAPYCEESLYFE